MILLQKEFVCHKLVLLLLVQGSEHNVINKSDNSAVDLR